jgi:CHASE4 domain
MVRELFHSAGGDGVTLRRKSVLIVAGTALALLAAMYAAGRATILAAALQLEKESVTLDLSRLVGALETEADHLLSTVGDWSTWDDTYAFVRERGAAYAEENLTDDTLRNLRVTSMPPARSSPRSTCPRGTSGGARSRPASPPIPPPSTAPRPSAVPVPASAACSPWRWGT